jgi:hypothetical protein
VQALSKSAGFDLEGRTFYVDNLRFTPAHSQCALNLQQAEVAYNMTRSQLADMVQLLAQMPRRPVTSFRTLARFRADIDTCSSNLIESVQRQNELEAALKQQQVSYIGLSTASSAYPACTCATLLIMIERCSYLLLVSVLAKHGVLYPDTTPVMCPCASAGARGSLSQAKRAYLKSEKIKVLLKKPTVNQYHTRCKVQHLTSL